MTIDLSASQISTVANLRRQGRHVYVHCDVFGRVLRIDSYGPTNWIAPTYEVARDGTLREC